MASTEESLCDGSGLHDLATATMHTLGLASAGSDKPLTPGVGMLGADAPDSPRNHLPSARPCSFTETTICRGYYGSGRYVESLIRVSRSECGHVWKVEIGAAPSTHAAVAQNWRRSIARRFGRGLDSLRRGDPLRAN